MSTYKETKTWLDRFWPILVIGYGITFALILALWHPTI
jgi:hypothetical protein